MKSIFFDLETTDLNTCGQILNYSFITVDDEWNIESEHNGSIHISRLQLPNPNAILANRVDVIEHQKSNFPSETTSMLSIRKYIQRVIDTSHGNVNLIGFNSNRFDVSFLRTSMIRNGINPYFGQSIVYKDVLHVAQKLALSDNEFIKRIGVDIDKDGNKKLSLRLAHLCKVFFGETQLHESRDDVLLTIRLAKLLSQEYSLDIRDYNSHEVSSCRVGDIKIKQFPSFDAKHHRDDSDKFSKESVVCYANNKNYSLWISLQRLEALQDKVDSFSLIANPGEEYKITRKDIKNCVLWFNKRTSSFYTQSNQLNLITEAEINLSKSAKDIVSEWDIDLTNYWPDKNCDIECFIYGLSFNGMDALSEAIQSNNLDSLKKLGEKPANVLYMRYFLNTTANIDNPVIREKLNSYALYRYGSRMKIDKMNTDSVFDESDPIYDEAFHASYNELMFDIDKKMINREDALLMKSLKKFYQESSMATKDVKEFNRSPF